MLIPAISRVIRPCAPYLDEALSRVAGQERIYEEIDFGRVIGVSNCVATHAGDDIVYAQRRNRLGWTRFVKNRQPEPCSSVVVVLAREPDGCYILRTAFLGRKTPAEPWDLDARTADSLSFWSAHALVWGLSEIVPGTETRVCPWQPEAVPGAPGGWYHRCMLALHRWSAAVLGRVRRAEERRLG